MNIKQIKSVLIKIWAIVFLVLFSTWLIGGCIYNSIGKESIQEDIQQLKQELYSIKPIQNYFVKNVALANRRAIIAKSLRANILPITTEYTSELTLYEFERYFIGNGWDIVEYRKRPSLHIKANNEKYVVTLDLISSMNDEWRIQIGYNNFFEKYNFLLNIEKPEEDLLASFHSKTRYNIRLAEKKGVSIIDKSTEEGMEDYIRLMEETTKRQGFFNHNAKYFQNLFKIFPKNSLKILEAVYNEEVLTAWILFNFNGKLYYPYGASGNNHRELMPNNLIMWEAIKYGKNLNCSVFDLWGCLGPNPNTADSWYGFHKFKSGYNPQLVEYIGTFDFVYKPFMYKLFNIADKIRWIILKNKRR